MLDHQSDGRPQAGASEEGTQSISKDDVFHVLQNARRRAVLRHLLEGSEKDRFRMRDVAEEVAAWEHDTTVRQLTSEERQRVYIALYQSHLPKLDDHGVIDYNQSRGSIEPRALLSVFEPYLTDELRGEEALSVKNAPADVRAGDADSIPTAVSKILGI